MNTNIIPLISIMLLICGCISTPDVVTTTQPTGPTTTRLECVMSLCDCKCHPKGTTVEETTGRLCGINCLAEYGVSDCAITDGRCTEITAVTQATTTTQPTGIPNPASEKCVQDGGQLQITSTPEGQGGVCIFPDGSVCDEWDYFRGECSKGDCMKKCLNIGTRSEGWYDCNDKLIHYDNCAIQAIPFCGWSTNASCSTNTDCDAGGCSGQVCQNTTEEPAVTTCEYRDCYNAANYSLECACAEGKCQWA